MDERGNFRMIAAVENSVFAVRGKLIGDVHAAVAEDATRHVQLDVWTDVVFLKGSPFKLIPGAFGPVIVTQVLQRTFVGLVTDRAVERMIDEQKLHHTLAGIDHFFAGNIFHDHAVHYIGAATGDELWHRPRIGRGTGSYFHQAGAAFTAAVFQGAVITHGRGRHVATDMAGRIQ